MSIRTKNITSAIVLATAAFMLSGCIAQVVPTESHSASTLEDNPLRGKTLTATFQPDWGLPLAAFGNDGKPEGLVYEIVAAAADKLGATIEIKPNDFSTTIPGVQSGKYDLGLGTDAVPDRQEVVDVVSTFLTGYQFITTNDHARLPAELKDFSGLKVAVIAGSSYIQPIQEASDQLAAAGKSPIDILNFPDMASSQLAVQSGRADTTLRYKASAGYMEQQNDGFKVNGPAVVLGESGFSVQKGSGNADLWRQAIDAIIADGTYANILGKYGVSSIAITHSTINPAK